ncbi:MAG TPA: hypothetical protein VK831_03085 [Candidatus Deferrimicrobiaceae bacterium]|nr:hypothetical protein [Candidatus Deferrimicrobiaceae bacterium]
MRDAHAELWLANQHIEREARHAALRAQLPPRRSPAEILRLRAGEALIATGRRLLPAPRQAPARAA